MAASGDGPMGPTRLRLSKPDALAEEFRNGCRVLEADGTRAGVQAFLEGRGRHGRFDD